MAIVELTAFLVVVGKVAVLSVAVVKVDSTSDDIVIVAITLDVVRLVTGLVEA